METVPALLTVAGSYAGWLVAFRRVRVARGRRAGPDAEALARYHHEALAAELGDLRRADGTAAAGALLHPPPAGPLGRLPEPWAHAPWAHAAPERLAEARDALIEGEPGDAVEGVRGAPRAAIRSLFAWAFLHALFAGRLARAEAIAAALVSADVGAHVLAHRLLARLFAVRAELAPPGPEREAVCLAGCRHLRRAGEEALAGGPAEAGLRAHFEVMRLSFWDLEWRELVARRHLRRALARHPQAPILHLVRAHLAAMLGDGEGAADHLARALYYARGDRFYARPILASAWVARMRPALAAEARHLLAAAAGGDAQGPPEEAARD